MSRLYKFVFDRSVPAEIRKEFPEHLEAGPATIRELIAEIKAPGFMLVEDEDDYLIHVSKRAEAA